MLCETTKDLRIILIFLCYVKQLEVYEFWVKKKNGCLEDENLMFKRWLMVRKHEIDRKNIRKCCIKMREMYELQDLDIEVKKWRKKMMNQGKRTASRFLGMGSQLVVAELLPSKQLHASSKWLATWKVETLLWPSG